MHGRPQPGDVVQGAPRTCGLSSPVGDQRRSKSRIGSKSNGSSPSAVSRPLDFLWLALDELEGLGREHQRHRKGAAGDSLTIGAVAGIDELRRLGDLVAESAALATAGLWELYRPALLSSGGLTAAVCTSYSNCRIGYNSCESEITLSEPAAIWPARRHNDPSRSAELPGAGTPRQYVRPRIKKPAGQC